MIILFFLPAFHTRHTSSCLCVGCPYSPQSLTFVSSWGLARLPPSRNLNYLGYVYYKIMIPIIFLPQVDVYTCVRNLWGCVYQLAINCRKRADWLAVKTCSGVPCSSISP
ncbi:hypothetical protein EG335_08210 [Pectobacterium versatile]|nr:hypothetical protein EG330_01460 [Pectobacterium versatile]TAI98371.1 hypothetical protein EG335_08210 [Pectobacterium versatile]TAI98478.1 hypothetical protein EG332_07870 [Pectobacterium versatile]